MSRAASSSVRLRPTREADLPYFLGLEVDPETAPFIHPWPVEDHRNAMSDYWGAHRLWLDVYDFNARARSLYQAEGFVAETTRPASEACGPGAEGTAIIMALEKSSPAFPRG